MIRAEGIREIAKIRGLEGDADARAAALDLVERCEDPLIRAAARAEEIRRSRALGEQQRAIVAGAEILPLLDPLTPAEDADERWMLNLVGGGLSSAVYAALDVPEVPFTAIDALIDAYAQVLVLLGLSDLSARQLRARRYFVSGDQEACAAIVEALMPHVNYTNGSRQRLGCPGCVLSTVAWYLGPSADLDLLEEMLTPIFEGQFSYPNEDPAVIRQIRASSQRCQNALGAHMHFARALMWRGRITEAGDHTEQVRHEDLDECYLLPTIFYLEVAMANGDPEAIRARIRLLRPRIEAHEDAQEAMLGAIRVAQALALVGDEPADQARAWEIAEHHARRLDARLERPRHCAEVATERAEGAPFLKVPRVEPSRRSPAPVRRQR